MLNNKKKADIDRIISVCLLVVFLVVNGYLVYIHEPWRDEVHAWLVAKYMSPLEMIKFSGYEGHPMLWSLLLSPFAKLGAPVWTMNVISYLFVSASAFLLLFYTRFTNLVKAIMVFMPPFIYIFSSIARNYCLILFFVLLISILYEKRYEHPIIYSGAIVFLVFTHALTWGMVAALTISFHMQELYFVVKKKSTLDKRIISGITLGFIAIAGASILVIITMATGRNSGYIPYNNDNEKFFSALMIYVSMYILVFSFLMLKDCKKEAIILVATLVFDIIVYKTVYSSVGIQRTFLINVFIIFFMIKVSEHQDARDSYPVLVLYLLPIVLFGWQFKKEMLDDVQGKYSSAMQMADYINQNLADQDSILIDSGNLIQTIVPYTDKKLYDIEYSSNIEDSLYHVLDRDASTFAVKNAAADKENVGKYLISVELLNIEELNSRPFVEIYRTDKSMKGENYILYRIEE